MRYRRRGAIALRPGEASVSVSDFGSIPRELSARALLKSWTDDARQPRDRQRNGISNVKPNGEFISTIPLSRDETVFVSLKNWNYFGRLNPAQRAGTRIELYDNVLS